MPALLAIFPSSASMHGYRLRRAARYAPPNDWPISRSASPAISLYSANTVGSPLKKPSRYVLPRDLERDHRHGLPSFPRRRRARRRKQSGVPLHRIQRADDRPVTFGIRRYTDLFNDRQLLGLGLINPHRDQRFRRIGAR
jgi:hypothetical protein